jgi:hypothetical protein
VESTSKSIKKIKLLKTFLKPELSSLPYNLNNYTLVRHDRQGKEGGVAIYTKNVFSFKIIDKSQRVYSKKS